MIFVFDVDDTLYEELTFVKSGFLEVSHFLGKKFGIDSKKFYRGFLQELEKGRGKIFDNILQQHNIYSKKLVKECLTIYRLHHPKIRLYDDSVRFFEKYKHISKYIVTDGNKIVQWNKVQALDLESRVKFAFITHRYGVKNAKPSPYCFLKISELEKEKTGNIIYFGDNPSKDFVGIKRLGFKTVRLLRGNYAHISAEKEFDADISVLNFDQVTEEFLQNLLQQ